MSQIESEISPCDAPPRERRSWARSIGGWSLELLLILVIVGVILATWMPAIVRYQDGKETQTTEIAK